MRLPEFEEEFNLPSGAVERMGLFKSQVGDVGQIDGPSCQCLLARRKRLLVEACLLMETRHSFFQSLLGQGGGMEKRLDRLVARPDADCHADGVSRFHDLLEIHPLSIRREEVDADFIACQPRHPVAAPLAKAV